jgi:hypothetical protein
MGLESWRWQHETYAPQHRERFNCLQHPPRPTARATFKKESRFAAYGERLPYQTL